MAVKIQLRRGTAASWSAANPVLSTGELGFENDTNRAKLGDGASNWNTLPYFGGGGEGGGGAVASVAGRIGDVKLVKADVGLSNVDNTSDIQKPVSIAQAQAIAAAGAVKSVNGATGDVSGLATVGTVNAHITNLNNPHLTTKAQIGLSEVDNTSDANKPVPVAVTQALNSKAPTANPTFTGTVAGVTKAHVGLGNVDNTADSAKPVSTAQLAAINVKVGSSNNTVKDIVKISQSAYDALSSKVSTTLYLIVG
jgi:hypothetical protein